MQLFDGHISERWITTNLLESGTRAIRAISSRGRCTFVKEGLSGKDLILATIIAYELKCVFAKSTGHACAIWLTRNVSAFARRFCRRGARVSESYAGANGHPQIGISAARTFGPRPVPSASLPT